MVPVSFCETIARELDAIECNVPVEPHGQGFKDKSPAVDLVERLPYDAVEKDWLHYADLINTIRSKGEPVGGSVAGYFSSPAGVGRQGGRGEERHTGGRIEKIKPRPAAGRGGGRFVLKLSKTFARGNHGKKIARTTDVGRRFGANLSGSAADPA